MYFKKNRIPFFCLITTLLFINQNSNAQKMNQPNIIVILADDMGYSDIGSYGSDIPTPNIDGLANNGLRFTNFYNMARCSPTRASILTGLTPHSAGMGKLAERTVGLTSKNEEGYLGYLSDNCVTLAEVLKPAGYKTILAGKWHLGMRNQSKWPLQRGFDNFYGLLSGAGSYFKPTPEKGYALGNNFIDAPTDPDYYTTDAFTNYAIEQINDREKKKPFFLYMSYNAPHWPLHAKEKDIAKFIGKYKKGWDVLRKEKYERMKTIGILSKDHAMSPRDEGVRAWDQLTENQKKDLDYRMAVYAAQVYCMDENIGKLVQNLKDKGEFDNTIIMFLSDNGACAEPYTDLGGKTKDDVNNKDESGPVSYGSGWANASNVPYRRFKSMLHEGGILTPLIVHWPNGLKTKPGSIIRTPTSVTDIMPTLVEISHAKYPTQFNGNTIIPMHGESLTSIINDKKDLKNNRTLYWEHTNYKAIREGNLKAVCSVKKIYDGLGTGIWELYDLDKDPTELNDLSKKQPKNLKSMISKWDVWANANKIYPQAKGSDKE